MSGQHGTGVYQWSSFTYLIKRKINWAIDEYYQVITICIEIVTCWQYIFFGQNPYESIYGLESEYI